MDAKKFSQRKIKQQKCLTCYFLRQDERNHDRCHRYAPRPSIDVEVNPDPVWPIVSEDDWCGEWKSK
jgi:hypothetical protein